MNSTSEACFQEAKVVLRQESLKPGRGPLRSTGQDYVEQDLPEIQYVYRYETAQQEQELHGKPLIPRTKSAR